MNTHDFIFLRIKTKKTQKEFAKLIGVSLRTIQNWEAGAVIPNSKCALLQKIDSGELNIDNVGVPFSDRHTDNDTIIKPEREVLELRLIPIDAMAGYGEGGIEVMDFEGETFRVPTFRGADFLISVKGTSMYPKYNSGDIVACKKIPLNDIFFQWNKVYVLDTIQGAIIKRIKKGTDDNHITLVSDNTNYDPFELHLSAINAVSIVMGVIRIE